MVQWLNAHAGWLAALGTASVLLLVLGGLAAGIILVRLPADYFQPPHTSRTRQRYPVLAALALVAKNAFGAVIVLAGVAMLVLPGQGVLTILAGLMLMNFPGKRRLELALVRLAPVQRSVNWLRARWGRPPLDLE